MMKTYADNKLSNLTVKHAKPQTKKYKLPDGGGLYCEVLSTGTKVWRYNYRLQGKQKTYTIGKYPKINLKQARTQRDQARDNVSAGIDPSQKKRVEAKILKEHIFQSVAATWVADKKPQWSHSNYKRTFRYLEKDIYPYLGQNDIATINAPEIIAIIKTVADRGSIDTAKRIKGVVQQVFDYALAYGKAIRNPAKDINLRLILPPTCKTHFASIKDPQILGQLLSGIDNYHGAISIKYALNILLLVMLRPSELSNAEWSEIDFNAKIWTVPAKHRKLSQYLKNANRREDAHIVPSSQQVMTRLKKLHQYTGKGHYIFPSPRGKSRPINSNSLRMALRGMGFDKDTITSHGFRGTASTFLNSQCFRSDAIEAQLSHKDKNAIRAAYNHADYMPERQQMLQVWADYLDTLRTGEKVVPIRNITE